MRLTHLSFRGITVFSGIVEIDFDALGPGLVALTGANGSGKTTTCEAVIGALYKTLPSRPGHLQNHCHGKDAFVEACFMDGADEVTVRVQVDSETRKTEQYIFVNGVSATTGRAAEHEAEVEKRFGSLTLLLASVFSCQTKAGNFLQASKVERKSLFVELLGLAHLEVLAESARQRATKAGAYLDAARREVAAVEAETERLLVYQMERGEADAQAERAAGALDTARTKEAAAVAQLERAKGAAERLAGLVNAESAAARELASAQKALDDARQLTMKAQKDADGKLAFLRNRKAEEMAPAARRRHQTAINAIEDRRGRLNAQLADVPDADDARGKLKDAQTARGLLEDQERRAADLEVAAKQADSDAKTAKSALEVAQAQHAREVTRLTRQAGLMDQAPCTASDMWSATWDARQPAPPLEVSLEDLAGTCPLLADARGAKAALAELQEPSVAAVLAAQSNARDARHDADAAKDPARLERIRALKDREATLQRDIARAEAATHARTQLVALAAEMDAADETLTADLEAAEAALAEVGAQTVAVGEELSEAILDADAKIHEAGEAVGQAMARHAEAKTRLTMEQGGPSLTVARAAQATAQAARKGAEAALSQAITARATVAAKVEALEQKAAQLPALRQSVTDAEREVGDWRLLEKGYGREGAQALEIDAVSPEITAIINELLSDWPGDNRYSLSFVTLREKVSARGEFAESFDVKVMHNGREKAVEVLSGGQGVVIDTAVRLAFGIYNARKSAVRWETLWLDEATGALDPDAAQAYLSMLRRALALGGFRSIIFVAHQPEVVEAADVRLVVAGGRVAVEGERLKP